MRALLSALWPRPAVAQVLDLTPHRGPVYAIGDIHGRLDLLQGLERRILQDAGPSATPLLVCLGDMIDRGPESYGVIEHLSAPPAAGLKRQCLMGNHEAMMLDFLRAPKAGAAWLACGGLETLGSYGAQESEVRAALARPRAMGYLLERILPAKHLDFLRALPHVALLPRFMLAHAGGHPARPPARQKRQDLLWGNPALFTTPPRFGKDIVHGHFVVDTPRHAAGRVAVDTGAYAGGQLTAARLGVEGVVRFISYG